MVGLAELWMPVLISAVAVFVASSVIWMALPIHKADIKFIPNEDEFTSAIKPLNLKPGLYMYPNCANSKDYKSEAFMDKWKAGPWGMITVMGAPPNFMMNLVKCFLSYLAITAMAGYLAGIGLGPGAEYMDVFRVVGTAAILGFCMGSFAGDFFLGKPTRFIITSFIDGVIFALITAGIFAAMWPDLATAIPAIP
tara:strand:+ start:28332 stop:28916 length:585 start_codon:yes stop_codon:yes gene_type:complete